MSQISTFDPRRRVREMLQGFKVLDAYSDVADCFCAGSTTDNFASMALVADVDASCAGAPSSGQLDTGKRLETSDVSNQQMFARRNRGLDIVIGNFPWQLEAHRGADEGNSTDLMLRGQRGHNLAAPIWRRAEQPQSLSATAQ